MPKNGTSEEENFLTKLVGSSGEDKGARDEEEDIDDLSDLGDESDDLDLNEEEEEDSDEKKNQRLESKIDGLNNKIDANVTLTRLLADPDVRAVLEAKKNPKKDNTRIEEEEESQEDYDKMSNKDLVQNIVKKFGIVLQGVVDEKLAPLNQKLSAVEGSLGNDQQEKAKKAVLKARRRFSDFDRFVPEMKEILKVNPGLDVKELYYLAKLRKTGDDRRAESERPKNHISRGKKQKVDYTGNRGFNNLVDAALDRAF